MAVHDLRLHCRQRRPCCMRTRSHLRVVGIPSRFKGFRGNAHVADGIRFTASRRTVTWFRSRFQTLAEHRARPGQRAARRGAAAADFRPGLRQPGFGLMFPASATRVAAMQSADDILARLETLNAIGIALSHERDLPTLLERILETAREFARADGGTLYRVEGEQLHFEVLRNHSLGFFKGGRHGEPIDFPPIPMYGPDGSGNHNMVVVHAALTGETVNIPDAYDAEGYDFSGTRAFDAKTGYRSQSFLTVPMKDHDGRVIGVLQLINAKDAAGNTVPFTDADQRLVESLASQAAIALNNRRLIDQLENLFEALINLINTAIDEKSPYTGGHCERVPVLTNLLAEAAHRTGVGP